jgi:hypothetical protein
MRRFIILAASIAALAVPAAAMADVAVNDQGVGTVGKGDVQTALGDINDATLQQMWKDGGIEFTASYNQVDDNTLNCMKIDMGVWPPFVTTGDTVHKIYTTPVTQVGAKVNPLTNPQGKVTGWTLDGFDGEKTYGQSTSVIEGTCPSGTWVGTTVPGGPVTTDGPLSLKVNGIDLPNTPVAPAV